jgi:hypothetical protein
MINSEESIQTKKKVAIWAVDPFDPDTIRKQSAIRVIQALAQKKTFEIEPVYLWNPYALNTPILIPHEWIEEIQTSAQEEFNKLTSSTSLSEVDIQPLAVLTEPSFTESLITQELVGYAVNRKASLILMCPKFEEWPKITAGQSLVDTLAFHSKIPVMVLNPSQMDYQEFKQILFLEEWIPNHPDAFNEVNSLANSLECEVTVLRELNESRIEQIFDNLKVKPGIVAIPAPKRTLNGRAERGQARKIMHTSLFPVYVIPSRTSSSSASSKDDIVTMNEQELMEELNYRTKPMRSKNPKTAS